MRKFPPETPDWVVSVYFFDIFGIDPQGRSFELIFFALVLAVGGLILWREKRLARPLNDTWLTWAVAGVMAAFGAFRILLLLTSGTLFFGEEGMMLPTYGVAIASGFAIGIWLSYRDAERTPATINGTEALDLAFFVILSALIGARTLYVLQNASEFSAMCSMGDCAAVIRFWEGGLVFFGGFVGALIGGGLWCKKNNTNFLAAADLTLPYVSLGHGFGRLGCIGAGCCFGNECDLPWAIQYPQGSQAWMQHVEHLAQAGHVHEAAELTSSLPVHPAPLYEAFGELAIFVFLAFFLRSRRQFAGQITAAWMGCYGVLRFVTELFRGDTVRGFIFELELAPINALLGLPEGTITVLSTSQTFSLGVIVVAGGLYWMAKKGEFQPQLDKPAAA